MSCTVSLGCPTSARMACRTSSIVCFSSLDGVPSSPPACRAQQRGARHQSITSHEERDWQRHTTRQQQRCRGKPAQPCVLHACMHALGRCGLRPSSSSSSSSSSSAAAAHRARRALLDDHRLPIFDFVAVGLDLRQPLLDLRPKARPRPAQQCAQSAGPPERHGASCAAGAGRHHHPMGRGGGRG
jgi:hypothetical protein